MATTSTPKRFSFTKQAIETLPQTDVQLDFYDTKTPHLTVRVAKRKVFYWYGKVRGRAQRVKLGVFPDLSVENARKFAQRVSANVAEGKPPIEERHDTTTLGKLFTTYLEVWAKPRKKSWQQDKYAYDRHLKHWQHRQLEDITKADLQRLHATTGTKHGTTTANRLRALLSKMWNVAIEHGYWTSDNPVSAVKKFPEQERERYLREDELPNFFAQLEADENQDFADYVRLSLFTGGRQANVLGMRWDQLNFDRAEWTIPADQFKSAKMQVIPLSTEALQVLEKRKVAAAESEWVFPGNGSTKHLTRPGKWWDALLERCKLSEHLTMHDLRRTLGSWQAAGGTSLLVIGKTLGHKDSRSTEVYARLDLDPVRKSVSEATKAIAAAAITNKEDDKELAGGNRLQQWIQAKINDIRELSSHAATEAESVRTSDGAAALEMWLNDNVKDPKPTPQLLNIIFQAGIDCARTNDRLRNYWFRKFSTNMNGQFISKMVTEEMQNGGISLTKARRNVAEKLDISLRTVMNHDKKYR